MEGTIAIPDGVPFDLESQTVGLDRRTGTAVFMVRDDRGPPRIDGYTVGAPAVTGDSPHGGEMHPDADELLYLLSGHMEVRLELPDGERVVDVKGGQALVVPRRVWHRIRMNEPGQLLHITPGPGGEHRPLEVAR